VRWLSSFGEVTDSWSASENPIPLRRPTRSSELQSGEPLDQSLGQFRVSRTFSLEERAVVILTREAVLRPLSSVNLSQKMGLDEVLDSVGVVESRELSDEFLDRFDIVRCRVVWHSGRDVSE